VIQTASISASIGDVRHEYIGNDPFWCLALSLIPFSLSLYGILTGTAVFKNSRIHHAKEPFQYWLTIAFECAFFVYLFGLFVVGVHHPTSH